MKQQKYNFRVIFLAQSGRHVQFLKGKSVRYGAKCHHWPCFSHRRATKLGNPRFQTILNNNQPFLKYVFLKVTFMFSSIPAGIQNMNSYAIKLNQKLKMFKTFSVLLITYPFIFMSTNYQHIGHQK